MIKSDDLEYEDHVITGVTRTASGYELRFGLASGLWIPRAPGAEPSVGSRLRLYGRGFGYPVRGVDVDGVEVYYRTPEQEREKFAADCERRDREQRERFEAERESLDATVAALPDVFRRRIERFRANCPTFRWEYEGYELSACVDAVKIAEALKTGEAVREFAAMPRDAQMRAVPGLSDQHSGNTFAMACRLALHYATEPENVYREHAAIAWLVGCEAAGCPPVAAEVTA